MKMSANLDLLTVDICQTVVSDKVCIVAKKKDDSSANYYELLTSSAETLCSELKHEYDEVEFVIKVPPEVYFTQLPTKLELDYTGTTFFINLEPTHNNTVVYNNKLYTYVETAHNNLNVATKAYCIQLEWCNVASGAHAADHVSVCNMNGWTRLGDNWDDPIHISGIKDLYTEYDTDGANPDAYKPEDVYFKASSNEYRMRLAYAPDASGDTTAKTQVCTRVQSSY